MDHGPAGLHGDLLDEGPQERLRLGDVAGAQEVGHVGNEVGDDFRFVELQAALGQSAAGLLGRGLQLLLARHVLADARCGVVDLQVGLFDHPPDAVQHQPDLTQFRLDRLQPFALLAGGAVHLLVQHLDQFADVALGQHMVAQLVEDQSLEPLGVEPRRLAAARAALEQGAANVVGVAPALGLGCGQLLAAERAADQTGEQVGAGRAARVGLGRRARFKHGADLLELLLRDDRGHAVFNPHRL